MSDKPPSLADEIKQARKPRLNVSLPPRQEIPDETIEARSHSIGEKWGSATQLLPKVPAKPPIPIAPLVSVRFDCPDYLDEELAVKAAGTRGPSGGKVTKTYLILQALKQAGYRVEDADLIEDRRRLKNKS
jgi:hypothetical protein